MKLTLRSIPTFLLATTVFISCSDDEVINSSSIPQQPEQLAELTTQYNSNISAYQTMMDAKAEMVDYTVDGNGNYKLQLSNQQIVDAYAQTTQDADIPLLSINEEGYWIYRLEGIVHPLTDLQGVPAPAMRKTGKGILTPRIALGEDGCWQVSYNEFQWKRLSDTPAPLLEGKSAAHFSLYRSVALNEETNTIALELRADESVLKIDTRNNGTAQAWKKFLMKSDDNVLLDYSYAGYDHGETAPKDAFAWGYKVHNVKQRMAQEGITALEAFIRILDENKLIRKTNAGAANGNAKIVVYFPAGEYILHDGAGRNFPYDIIGGNFIIKGDGAQQTRLVMKTPNGDTEKTNTPMLSIKHTNSPSVDGHSPLLATVVENTKKGAFSLAVSSTSALKVGKWVQLRLRSNHEELLTQELGPIIPLPSWSIMQAPLPITGNNEDRYGVKITEFHQIKSVSGDRVTFYEPMMHDVNIKYNDCLGWEIRDYKYYENVGVEDLTFVGQAITPYYHHGDGTPEGSAWKYDQEYRPLAMSRLVNSWVRNVNFESVSEALTFSESTNCSAYNIEISGHRGHGAVRAAGSTRVFIGKVRDLSRDGLPLKNGVYGEGQWHGCGISKPSIGNVIWNSNWGSNACFEAHASQPRATLLDKCSGGLLRYHAGGAEDEAPNHLSDLTFWNLNVTGTTDESNKDYANDFIWWKTSDKWWKIYPPIVIGTHGKAVTFSQEERQLTYEESTGTRVTPESLYEAQLEKRLGTVPAWVKALR